MHIDKDALFLYNLTLLHPTAYTCSVLGQFRGIRKSFELVLVSATLISLYSTDAATGKLRLLSLQPVMGVVFAVDLVRPTGSAVDLLVVLSDSGNLSILQYSSDTMLFNAVAQLPLTKNGFSRLHSGLYLAVDPYNRAICVASLESTKLVIAVSSVDGRISLDLPLEAPSPKIACLCIVALELRLQNPLFAALECLSPTSLMLNYYEFDQGLNHIVRRKARGNHKLPPSASHLVPLPDPIGGVLVCCDTFLIYDSPASTHVSSMYVPLPRPANNQARRIICHTLHRLKKNDFFLVLQTQHGDLFKVSADYNTDRDVLVSISASYFSSIPPSASIHIFKAGYLFANAWITDQKLYQIQRLENTKVLSLSSSEILDISGAQSAADSAPAYSRGDYSLLEESDSLPSQTGIVDLAIAGLSSQSGHSAPGTDILALCSTHLKRLRRGAPTTVIVESPLPLLPTTILTCRLSSAATQDQYMVLSSLSASQTVILSIGEVVEEVEDSHFVLDQNTLAVHQLGMFSVAQVHTTGIRHVRRSSAALKVSTTDWFPPAGIRIVAADASNTQIVVGLSNDEMCYFEVDALDDQLIEYQDRLQASSAITSLALWHGHSLKSLFVAMGCTDSTVSVVSLQEHNCLETLSLQALSAVPTSLLILSLGHNMHPFVHVGLESGVLTRTALNPISGVLSNSRSQYLGNLSVSLVSVASPVAHSSSHALLALSSQSFLGYSQDGSFSLLPLLGITATCVAPIVSEDIGGKAIVAISNGQLVIFLVGDSETGLDPSQEYVAESTLLTFPPRNMALAGNIAFVTEYDHIALDITGDSETAINKKSISSGTEDTPNIPGDSASHTPVIDNTTSCVEVVDYSLSRILQKENLPFGERPLSSTIVRFETTPKQQFLIVGCTLVHTYTHSLRMFAIGKDLSLKHIHTTTIDEPPHALLEFDGKLAVGMGPYIRLYDSGRRQLLRKASSRINPFEKIVRVAHCGHHRLAVSDARQATAFVKYDAEDNSFTSFANDCVMRHLTSLCVLDYDTVIGGDKWGNVHVSRAPRTLSFSSDHDWPLVKNQDPFLNSSGARLTNECEYHLGDLVTSLATREGQGMQPTVIYGGVLGLIGCFAPLASKQEAEYFLRLQYLMEKHFAYDFADFDRDQHIPNLLGKDHLKYRSSFNPHKNVIDGDFLALFPSLRPLLKLKIAGGLERTPAQVESKIDSMRTRCVWA